MDNKKYLDRILDHLVRGTKIDYENGRISFHSPTFRSFFYYPTFSKYCRNQFGLTKEEINYVWDEYRDIIKDKMDNGE